MRRIGAETAVARRFLLALAPAAAAGLVEPARAQGGARIAGWLAVEGHVPAPAIRRALAERLAGIAGLAVPGMPVGTPSMEVPGPAPDTYDVIAWGADGSHRLFMRFVSRLTA